MSTKLNVPLFMFALMIQCVICGMVYIMPDDVKAAMPGYSEPSFLDIGALVAAVPNPNIIDILDMIYGVIAYLCFTFCSMLGYFFLAPMTAIGLLPFILQVPIAAFLLALDALVAIDIILVIKGLAENLI